MKKRALILAAGKGTRLKPFTDHCPKPLLPVFFIPQILYTIHLLKEHGFDEIGINLHHLPDQIAEFLSSQSYFKAQFQFFREEPEILDSGGGIRNAADWLFEFQNEALVINADQITNYPIHDLLEFHHRKKSTATMGLIEIPGVGSRYNEVKTTDGIIKEIKKASPEGRGDSQLGGETFCGIQVLGKKTVYNFLPENQPSSVISSIYKPLMKDQKAFCFSPKKSENIFFLDTGTPWDFYKAHLKIATLLTKKDRDSSKIFFERLFENLGWRPQKTDACWHHPSSKLSERAQLGENTFVGDNVLLEEGTYSNLVVFEEHSLKGAYDGNPKILAFSEEISIPEQ